MAKVKVRVLDAVVDGKIKGSVIEVEEKSAKHLESIRYVKRVPKNTKLFDASVEAVDDEEDDTVVVDGESDGGDTDGN